MGIFSNLFGKEKDEKKEEPIFFARQDDLMKNAIRDAQKNFKYFWRELYWEYRRIVPAHDFAMVKIPFEQKIEEQAELVVEHMWIDNINFDGETITGELVNEPNQLTNITKGDVVSKRVSEIGDWMISIQGKTYGGFTIQVMRSGMSDKERRDHDKAWGLNFGDFKEILLVYEQKEKTENLIEHPMSKNMAEKIREYFNENPSELTTIDEDGLTFLHKEAIAGNKTSISILLDLGADKTIKSEKGLTALDYAKSMNWEHLFEILN